MRCHFQFPVENRHVVASLAIVAEAYKISALPGVENMLVVRIGGEAAEDEQEETE